MNIIITGAYGFLGTHLSEALKEYNPYRVSSGTYDLRIWSHIDNLFKHTGKPDIIFHCAANIGGLEYNLKNPATIFYDNVIMNTELIRQAALHACGKFVFVSSVCAYPKFPIVPTKENQLWQGPIEASNETYGLSKLIALSQLKACRKQYGMSFEYPILANLYGPGDSGFFNKEKSHLIPNLIKKFLSHPDEIVVFGQGKLSRDFLYVKDATAALLELLKTNVGQEINISSGQSVTKRELVDMLVEITGYNGEVRYDMKVDKGQLKRQYNISLAKKLMKWRPEVTLFDGLKRTVEWYASNCNDQ